MLPPPSATSCAPVQRLGFSVLATGEKDDSKPLANIVFVHGLRGHPKQTWEQRHSSPQVLEKEEAKVGSSRLFNWRSHRRSKSLVITEKESTHVDAHVTYWPQDLLPQKVPNARILTYGYDADVIGGLFEGASKNNITQHGRDLMLQLEREICGEPIIFLAHSLGGILVKEGLHWSKSHISPRYQQLHRCTKHVVFLGVPHRGSRMANMGEILTHLANAALRDTNKHIVSSLEVDGEILDRIHSEFMKMLHAEDFTVHSFQEGLGLSGLKGFSGKVVNDFSSKLDHPLEIVETINGNHMQMSRFNDAEDPGFRKVSSVIAGYVRHLQQNQKGEGSTTSVDLRNALPTIQEKRYFRVPYISNSYFIGRAKELRWLRAHLEDLATEEEQQRLVIWGSGGVGKTQLVSTYVLRNRSNFSAVFWVTASSDFTLRKTYADIAKHLELATPPGGDQQAAIDSVRDWFTDYKQADWLLVIDNADKLDEVDIETFIPPTNKGSVIITSRNRQAAGFGTALELGEMDAGDASALLLRRAAIHDPTPTDEIAATEITKSLGYLALAIEHAGAYVQSVGGTLQDYQLQFQSSRKSTLEKSPRVSMHKESVFETFNISFNTIMKRNLAAARLLSFISFLDAETILESLILSTNESITVFYAAVIADRQGYLQAVQELLSFSLIRIRLEGGKKSISLHPLVHYLSRARLNTENQWRWKERVVIWLFQSSIATGADMAYFPHVREQMKQIKDFADSQADPQKRRRIYCYLGVLQHEYLFAWHSQGAMVELHKYSEIVLKVLEENLEDNEYLSVVSRMAVTSIQTVTVQFVASNSTYDQVLRQYLLKRMTPSAVLALESASALGENESTIGNTAGTGTSLLGDVDAKEDDLLDIATLTTAMTHKINPGPVAVGKTAQQGNSSVEGIKSMKGEETETDPVRCRYELAARDGFDAGSSDLFAAEKEAGVRETPLHRPTPPNASPQTVEKQDDFGGKPPSIIDLVTKDHSFRPKCLSEVFVSLTPPIHVQCLMNCLNTLVKVYYSHQRTAEAGLLFTYSTLPLNTSQNTDLQPQQVLQMLIEAGRFAAQGNLEGVLDVFQKIIIAGDKSILEARFTAMDYAIIMNKLGRPKEAELVLKQMFHGVPGQLEQDLAREFLSEYVWIRKTLSVAQRLQGHLEQSLQTLLLTLQTTQTAFGPNSLSSLHAVFLLQLFYSEAGDMRFQSHTEAAKYAEEFVKIFENLYGDGGGGGGERRGVHREEGLQMGMILWSQGALEEAVHIFDSVTRLATTARNVLDEDDRLTKKARRAAILARKEWSSSTQARNTRVNALKFGTFVFPRKMDDLASLVEEEDGIA